MLRQTGLRGYELQCKSLVVMFDAIAPHYIFQSHEALRRCYQSTQRDVMPTLQLGHHKCEVSAPRHEACGPSFLDNMGALGSISWFGQDFDTGDGVHRPEDPIGRHCYCQQVLL